MTGWGGNESGQISPCASNIVAIAASYQHSLYLLEDGTVADCGMFFDGTATPITVPPGLSNVVAISAGMSHSLALKADRTVVAWGLNTYGQTDIPPGLTNVAAIATGARHSLALKTDGTLVGWGPGGTNIPGGISNVVAISAGPAGNNLALKADGTVVSWGFRRDQTAAFATLSNIVSISAGDDWSYESWLALKDNGDVISCSPWTGATSKVQSNTIAIACSIGTDHHISLALKANGTVTGWGYNFYGGPNVPVGLNNVVAIAAGAGHQLALVGGGAPFIQNHLLDRVAVMGGKAFFRIEATGARPLTYQWKLFGTNLPGATSALLALNNLQPNQAGSYSVAVSNAFGGAISESAQLTLTPMEITQQPTNRTNIVGTTATFNVEVLALPPLFYQWRRAGVDIDAATNSVLVLNDVELSQAGDYSVVVSNAYGTIVSSNAILTIVPILITQPGDTVIYIGGSTNFAVGAQGQPPFYFQWQHNGQDITGATNSSFTVTNARRDQAGQYRVAVSNSIGAVTSRLATLSVVNVAAWGNTNYGLTTVLPASLTNTLGIAIGYYHSLALTSDGNVVGWGHYSDGTNVPAGLTNVIAVAGGSYASSRLVLTGESRLIRWGANPSVSPPADLTNAVASSVGGYHIISLRSDGTVKVWGLSDPVLLNLPPNLTNTVAVSAGQEHNLILKSDGTLVAWGYNSRGQTNIPNGLDQVVAIAAGQNHNLALRANGKVTAWGDNFLGQSDVPADLTNVVAISAGGSQSLALKDDGSVVVWGWSGMTNIPVGLTNVIAVAAGGVHSLALIGDAPPVQQALQVNPTWNSSGFSVNVPTQSGRVYRLEYKDTADDLTWKALPLVAGNGHLKTLADPTASANQRFYRVCQW